MNEEKKTNKGLMAFLITFAIIGVISVMGLAFYGLRTVVKNSTGKALNASVKSDTVEVSLDDIIAEENNDIKEGNIDKAEESVDADSIDVLDDLKEDEANGTLKDAKMPINVENSVVGHGDLKIVFLGDSIIDNVRDNTGVCSILANELNATVYNLGADECSASIPRDATLGDTPKGKVSKIVSGAAIAEVMAGLYSDNNIMDCTAKTVLKKNLNDIKNADIYIIEYGLYDFMAGRDNCNYDYLEDPTTYEGGLRHIVRSIRSFNPDANIMLCEPSYAYYNRPNGDWIGDTYSLDNGLGTLFDYAGKTDYVATDMECSIFKLEFQGVGPQNLDDTLIDGVHMTEAGRRLYAESLAATFIRQGILDENKQMVR